MSGVRRSRAAGRPAAPAACGSRRGGGAARSSCCSTSTARWRRSSSGPSWRRCRRRRAWRWSGCAACPGASVAVVSGRGLADTRERAGLAGDRLRGQPRDGDRGTGRAPRPRGGRRGAACAGAGARPPAGGAGGDRGRLRGGQGPHAERALPPGGARGGAGRARAGAPGRRCERAAAGDRGQGGARGAAGGGVGQGARRGVPAGPARPARRGRPCSTWATTPPTRTPSGRWRGAAGRRRGCWSPSRRGRPPRAAACATPRASASCCARWRSRVPAAEPVDRPVGHRRAAGRCPRVGCGSIFPGWKPSTSRAFPRDRRTCSRATSAAAAACRRPGSRLAEARGYEEVIPPTFEYEEVFTRGGGPELASRLVRFVDQRRPAGGAARRLHLQHRARGGLAARRRRRCRIRLCYAGKVYRQEPEGAARRREIFQLGAELIGDGGAGGATWRSSGW